MKFLLGILAFSMVSAHAADFKCKSQQSDMWIFISEGKQEIIVKSKTGQVLQSYSGLSTRKYTVETFPLSNITEFYSGENFVLELDESVDNIFVRYKNEYDIICLKSKKSN